MDLRLVPSTTPGFWIVTDDDRPSWDCKLPGHVCRGNSFFTFYYKGAWTCAHSTVDGLKAQLFVFYTAFPLEGGL